MQSRWIGGRGSHSHIEKQPRRTRIGLHTTKRHRLPPPYASRAPGPDRASIAALEAAIAAINKILGGSTIGRVRSTTGKQSASITSPSKLFSFSARAKSSVQVDEVLRELQAQHCETGVANGSSDTNANTTDSTSGWFRSLANGRQLAALSGPPPAALLRSLQAYLALPLEQYSVLDPRLITRLPPGADIDAELERALELAATARAARRAASAAARAQREEAAAAASAAAAAGGGSSGGGSAGDELQHTPPTVSAASGLQVVFDRAEESASGNAASASSGSGEAGVQPVRMRILEECNSAAAQPERSAAESEQSASADSEAAAAAATADEAAAAAAAASAPNTAVDDASGSGAFMLRVPMLELLGIDLEPLLVMRVDIDAAAGKVQFHTDRLVAGVPGFDREFKVSLTATLGSRVTQRAVQDDMAEQANSVAADDELNGAEPGAGGDGPSAAAEHSAVWKQRSSLSCAVRLSMTLRAPPPLALVPGPLLSTTAGLVARLVMQALLPSFLGLLAADYNRWADGSSTVARNANPAGSLIAGATKMRAQ